MTRRIPGLFSSTLRIELVRRIQLGLTLCDKDDICTALSLVGKSMLEELLDTFIFFGGRSMAAARSKSASTRRRSPSFTSCDSARSHRGYRADLSWQHGLDTSVLQPVPEPGQPKEGFT